MTNHLLLKMHQLSYPSEIVVFFQEILCDWHTTLTFNGFTSDLIPMDNSIGQGKPSLMILYLIYIYVLPAIPSLPGSNGGSYVGDTFWATCDTFEDCDRKLNVMLDK